MSYSIISQCCYCYKEKECKDLEKIQEAVSKIHETSIEEGHKGAGNIILNCSNQNT